MGENQRPLRLLCLGESKCPLLLAIRTLTVLDGGDIRGISSAYILKSIMKAINLEARTRVIGAEHLDTLSSMNNLARMYRHLGHYDESVALISEAAGSRTTKLAADHLDNHQCS